MPWWVYFLLVFSLASGYFITDIINKKTNAFKKIPTWVILPMPFLVFLIIGLPLMFITKNFDITFHSVSYIMVFLFGSVIAIFIVRYNNWRARKKMKYEENLSTNKNKDKNIKEK